ncbi:uncharacterized protein BJ171DRAFT_505111 [Polychytrium aggregatum]|uniref:uncharacterized protein n=1 Tax=Polychytrium aggregatum TaxID=110093 RepID=UPI0022FDC025|nr:uncharacterized protein BJ171DRAFT_505111 [Polychytrium aggregatum]KAI9204693.1 hypothetical protein BJ171DRAFT_505111 [Polychytrium aggregatum]
MTYLHDCGIIHGDLKAANVLLDEHYGAVISDFGLSRTKNTSASLNRSKANSFVVGTDGFMAPEMLDDDRPSGTTMKTDVFAFAITVYEVLNDADPIWVTDNDQPMHERVIERQVRIGNRPKRLDGIPDDVWSLIECCWHQEPDQRPAFPKILALLEPYQLPSPSYPSGPSDPLPASTNESVSESASPPVSVSSSKLVPEPDPSSQNIPRVSSFAPPPSTPTSKEVESLPDVSRRLLQQARKGDPDSCVNVATIISNNKLATDPLWIQAAQFLQTAANQKHPEACFHLGWLYFAGIGLGQNDIDALVCWQETSRAADPILKSIATFMMGWLCYLGRGTSLDKQAGIELIRQSKADGFPLGEECMDTSSPVGSDSPAARRFFELCQLGSDRDWLCKHLAAVCFVGGLGTAKDQTKAVAIFEELANQDYDPSQHWLGHCHKNGWGRPINHASSIKWYTRAANQDNSYAQNMVGRCYEEGWGVTVDRCKAVEWYRKAAEQGNPSGQNNLGDCYEKGIGVPKDSLTAVQWYSRSAEQGNASGQNNLGLCYCTGNGVSRDYFKAAAWYTKSAEQGNSAAQYALGSCYKHGVGVAQSIEAAVLWYRKAADQGDADAKTKLRALGR